MNRVTATALITVAALSGCATAPTEADYARMEQRYRGSCERAGFVADIDIARCIAYSAGYQATASPENLEQRLMRLYGERCQLAGYHPHTGAFGQCLLSNADRDEQARRALAVQLLQYQAQKGQPANPNYVDPNMFKNLAPPTPQMRQCTSIVGNQIIQTTCY